MKRALFLMSILTVLPTAQAQSTDNGWTQIGTYVKQACNIAQGSSPWFGGSGQLDWICNLASTYGFLSNNILNGDWQSFAQEVIGKYSSEYVTHLGDVMGMSQLNTLTDDLNTSLHQSYANFRSTLLNAMTNTIKRQLAGQLVDDNASAPAATPGALADWAVQASPYLTVAQTVGRTQNTATMFANLLKAAQAKKLSDQSNDAIESALTPAMDGAAKVIGTGITKGFADSQDEKAKTALSAREVQELHLNSFDAFMKQDAAFRMAELQMLSEIAKQGVMTNTQLLQKLGDAQAAQASAENALKAEVEQAAKENLDQAASAARQYTQLTSSFSTFIDPASVDDAEHSFVGGL